MVVHRGISVIFRLLFLPVSLLWSLIHRVRRFAYRYGMIESNSFRVPIISIGNITFGGTGKTPMAIWIAKFFEHRSLSVLVLNRGYKGRLENSSGLIKCEHRMGHDPVEFGDEALLIARHLKKASVLVGKNRSANLDYYFDELLPDVVVLDDGYQHLKLNRSLNIAMFDALMPITKYRVAPLGLMRESFSSLTDADVVVIGRSDFAPKNRINELKELIEANVVEGVPIVEMGYRATGLFDGSSTESMPLNSLRGRRVVCLSGIASPEYFYAIVESMGSEIIRKITFPDHHYFTREEINQVLDYASANNAVVITTEKDIVKLKRINKDRKIFFVEVDVYFIRGQDQLEEKLLAALN